MKYTHYGEADIADLTRAIQKDPLDAELYSERAFVYSLRDDFEQSITDWSKAIELDPENAYHWLGRASTYLMMTEHEKAVADYTKAERLANGNPQVLFGVYVGRIAEYFYLGEHEAAIADCNTAMALFSANRFRFLAERAKNYRVAGHLHDAVRDYSELMQIDSRLYIFYLEMRIRCNIMLKDMGSLSEDYMLLQKRGKKEELLKFLADYIEQFKDRPQDMTNPFL